MSDTSIFLLGCAVFALLLAGTLFSVKEVKRGYDTPVERERSREDGRT